MKYNMLSGVLRGHVLQSGHSSRSHEWEG